MRRRRSGGEDFAAEGIGGVEGVFDEVCRWRGAGGGVGGPVDDVFVGGVEADLAFGDVPCFAEVPCAEREGFGVAAGDEVGVVDGLVADGEVAVCEEELAVEEKDGVGGAAEGRAVGAGLVERPFAGEGEEELLGDVDGSGVEVPACGVGEAFDDRDVAVVEGLDGGKVAFGVVEPEEGDADACSVGGEGVESKDGPGLLGECPGVGRD